MHGISIDLVTSRRRWVGCVTLQVRMKVAGRITQRWRRDGYKFVLWFSSLATTALDTIALAVSFVGVAAAAPLHWPKQQHLALSKNRQVSAGGTQELNLTAYRQVGR